VKGIRKQPELSRNVAFLALAVAFISGCGGVERRTEPLPFVVKLNEVRIEVESPVSRRGTEESDWPGEGDEDDGAVETPPIFASPRELTRAIQNEARVFTDVVTGEDPELPADLEFDIAITGTDFGPGQPNVGSGVFSTVAWLVGGHVSWFIDNREYSDSDVIVNATIRKAGQKKTDGVFQDNLIPRSLQLNLIERANMGEWFLNILIPPVWVAGDSELAGTSLAKKLIEYFVEEEPVRIANRLPGSDQLSSFLVYDRDNEELLIVARQVVDGVTIESTGSGRSPRTLSGAEFARDHELPDADRGDVRLRLSRLGVGIGVSSLDFLYRIGLREDEVGRVRITTELGRSVATWTIDRDGRAGVRGFASAR